MPSLVAVGGSVRSLAELTAPLPLDRLVPGTSPWEVELGFGKGRYLLVRAAAEPEGRFLGVEVAAKYFGLACERARRRGLSNVILLRGDALYLLGAVLPHGFARAVHVYFPDPWPKSRHHKRRLFEPEGLDLLLGLLEPGGFLYFATDHLEYGARVEEILRSHPALSVERVDGWEEGPRTNYEVKYEAEGRPIQRLAVRLAEGCPDLLHPAAVAGLLAATAPRSGSDGEGPA